MVHFSCRFAFIVSSNCIPKLTRSCCALQSTVERAFSCSSLRRRSFWIICKTDDLMDPQPHVKFFSDCSVALRFVFLTQQQWLNCVDVSIVMHGRLSPVELHQQPVDAVLRPTFVERLCYKLSSVVAFTFIQIFDQNFVSFTERRQSCRNLPRLLDTASKFALFSVSGLKDKNLIKNKPTWKLKHENYILYTFEYFCQTSSKSIIIISSYTVLKLRSFLRHSVVRLWLGGPAC